jgi:hypothetical protein
LGCLRCRTKSKDCSLTLDTSMNGQGTMQGSSAGGWNGSAYGQYPGGQGLEQAGIAEVGKKLEAIDEAWRLVSQRLGLIEEHILNISAQTSQTATTHTNAPTTSLNPVPQPLHRPISGSVLNTSKDARDVHVSEQVSTLVAMEEFPDVVKRGIFTAEQVEMAFQM